MPDDDRMVVAVDIDMRSINAAFDQLEARSKSLGSVLTASLKSAVLAGKDLDDVLRSLALSLSGRVLNASLKPLAGLLDSAFAGLGGALAPILPFAKGGVVGGPTAFAAGGGIGVMGEAGAEAILPLARGPDGRLGVAAASGAAQMPVIINVTTPDASSFRKSEAQITAMLARTVGRGRRGL